MSKVETYLAPIECREQIEDAYRRMATEARYYPMAPSDGFGNITAEPDVSKEAARYAAKWWAEEDEQVFTIGCCDFTTRAATICAIEAAREMCGVDDATALRLLRMAVAELERVQRRG
jgi:hypothetical protein